MTFESTTRETRAQNVVDRLGVKRHIFLPSGNVIVTVVGREGDLFVDLTSGKGRDFCSCEDFHFRVLRGEVKDCYHLLAAKLAQEQSKEDIIEFSDEEYTGFERALLSDVLRGVDYDDAEKPF